MNLYNFYRSKEWTDLLQILKLERLDHQGNIICAHCGKPIVKAYDCIGHHKIYLTELNYIDVTISLNPENIDLVHHKCHNIIHNKLSNSGRQVYIVYGSPLSGKTSYVNEIAEQGDLIIDIDSIWQCVSGCDRYVKPKKLNAVVFSVRDKLLDAVKYRQGKWSNAYVIGGYPLQGERERLIDTLGAREIYIESTKEECLLRLKEDVYRDEKEWSKYIDSWWRQYQGTY